MSRHFLSSKWRWKIIFDLKYSLNFIFLHFFSRFCRLETAINKTRSQFQPRFPQCYNEQRDKSLLFPLGRTEHVNFFHSSDFYVFDVNNKPTSITIKTEVREITFLSYFSYVNILKMFKVNIYIKLILNILRCQFCIMCHHTLPRTTFIHVALKRPY